jgi:hypothetical protein
MRQNLSLPMQRLITVRFEDLLEQPETTLRKVCQHIEVEFNSNMLNITQESSSIEKDSQGNWI